MTGKAWLLSAVAVLVGLPAVGLAIAVTLFDPNDYKAALADAVQGATGRALSLNGPLSLRWSLRPTFTVTDVTLANLPQGSRPDMARAESIEVEISLAALLWRQIEVVKLTLVGPNILFEQVNGVSNWVFTPPHPVVANVPATQTAPAEPESPGLPLQLRIRNVHIRNGMVTWRLPARTKVLGIRSLDGAHHVDDGPISLSAVLVYSDNQPFNFEASAQPTNGLTGPWNTRMSFAAFDTTASAQGTMDLAASYDLQIEATSGNLDRLNALLPEMDLPALRRMTLSARLLNGRVPGDLPVIGATKLHFADGDLGAWLPGLRVGAFDMSLPDAGGEATIDGTAQYTNQPFKLTGKIGVPLYLDARNAVPVDLKAEAVAAGAKGAADSLAIKGSLKLDTLAFAGLDGDAASRVRDLVAWRSLVKGLPALSDVRFDGHLSFPADAGAVRFRAAKLATNVGTLSGEGTASLGTRRGLQAKVTAGQLALVPVLDAFGIPLPSFGASAATTGPVIPATRLPWANLQGLNIDLQGSINALTAADQVWHQVEVALQLSDGRLRLGSLRTALPAGPLELAVTADTVAPAVPVTLSLRSPGVPLALIARYAGLPGEITGTIRIDAQLRGNGASPHDLAASLDGPVSATAIGGEMSNAMLIALTSASLDALGITVPPQGQTALGCLGLIGSFENGVGRFKTIALETTYLSLEGAGQVDLGQETLGLKLRPLAQVSGSPVEVPVVVEGSFRSMSGRLDASGLDKVGLLIDGLFGGDTSNACAGAGLVRTRGQP